MKFYRCQICGNIITVIDGDIKRIRCCGKEMEELVANSVDASLEKHVPVVEKNGDNIKVTVGSTIHPMEEEHYIEWIAIVKDNAISLKKLAPNMEPIVELPYLKESTIYAYCNIHGLWKTNLD